LVANKYAEKIASRIYSNNKINPVEIEKREKFLQLIKSQSKVAVYPAGGMASDFSKSEFFRYLNVVAFFDLNSDKIGKRINGIDILDINVIAEIKPSAIVIAVSTNLLTDLVAYLNGLGLINVEIIVL
jgi:NADH/NAD ratio-sensing transcriptional regulator Rex